MKKVLVKINRYENQNAPTELISTHFEHESISCVIIFLFIANSILTCPCALLIAILPSHVVPITTCTLYHYLAWE